jgi:hypothetical protein
VEILSHVINAYIDIYSEDNMNHILKEFEIVEKMNIGVNDFKTKVD